MLPNGNVDILYTSLVLPRDIVEQLITLTNDQRLSLSQIATEAVMEYMGKTPQEPTSFCTGCNTSHPKSEFYRKKNGSLMSECKERHKARASEWQKKNRGFINQRRRFIRQKKKAQKVQA